MTFYAYNAHLHKELEVVATYGPNGEHGIYADALTPFAKMLKARIRRNYQNVVAVTGPTGSGKSSLAISLCLAIDPTWSLKDNYIYSVGDLKRKLASTSTSSPISLFDEGSVSLNSGNAMRREDKELVTLFDTMRSLGWTSVICIPSIDSLNRKVREHHIDFMLMCPSSAPIKGYDPRGFAKIYRHVYRDWGKPYYELIATTLYPKLPRKVDEQYQRIKKAHQMELISKFIDQEDE